MRREFEPVGPTLLKKPLDAWWGLLPTLRWVGSCLSTALNNQLMKEGISDVCINKSIFSYVGVGQPLE